MASSLSGAPSLAGGSTAVVRGLTVTGGAGFGAPVSISHGFQGGAVLTGTGSVSMTGMDLPAEVDITNSTPANGSAMVVNGLRVRFPQAGNAPGAQVRGLRLETGDGGNYNRADIGFVSAGNVAPANGYNFLQFTIPPCTTGGLFLRAPPSDPALARVGVNKSAPNYELDVVGSGHFTGNVYVDGNVTVSGTTTTVNTALTVSQQTVITNAGTGPALLVTQTGVQQLARFVDDAVGNVFVIHSGGGISIGSGTAPAAGTALAVTGNVSISGASQILTNGVAIGTSIEGTFLSPAITPNVTVSCYSVTVTPGTWLMVGSVQLQATSTGTFYVSIGPSSTNINQNNSRVQHSPVVSGDYIALRTSFVFSCSVSTTYYVIALSS